MEREEKRVENVKMFLYIYLKHIIEVLATLMNKKVLFNILNRLYTPFICSSQEAGFQRISTLCI